jgi:hypothetical protein
MPLVSKTEAAKLAGVTRQTIHRRVKSGDLSATGGEIDTSELLRVFGTLQRPLDITDEDSGNKPWATRPDPAVEVLARVDALESQLAVTREQLSDTARDRDEWREIAKEATSNVKLITNQGGTAKSNDNMIIFIGVAFIVGLGLAYMMLRDDMSRPVSSDQTAESKTYLVTDNDTGVELRLENLESEPTEQELETAFDDYYKDGVTDIKIKEQGNGDVIITPVVTSLDQLSEEAEQGADVTDNVTPELQADNGSN